MLGSFIGRFRVAMLLLAFGVGVAGQAVSNMAAAAEIKAPLQLGVSAATLCPGCPDPLHGMAPGCAMMATCWSIPALLVQSSLMLPRMLAIYPVPLAAVITGIRAGPDPHPPRPPLHS